MAEGSDKPRPRRTRRVVAAIGALAVLVALAAIFDIWPFNDSGPLTRAEFIAKGDEICKDAHEQFVDLQPSPPNTASEAAVLTGNLLSISQDEYNAIRDLEAPAELRAPVIRYLEARLKGIDLIEDAYNAAKDDEPKRYYRDLIRVSQTQVDRLRLARDVGFTECSKPIGALDVAAER